MADYGLNFGFRRSGGDDTVREGRYRVPAGVTVYHQGDLVTIDTAGTDTLTLATAGDRFEPGVCGFLIQEHEMFSIYEVELGRHDDSSFRGVARQGYLATIWSGLGLKIWMRNTAQVTRPDGHVVTARALFPSSGITKGSTLQWTGTAWAVTTSGSPALRVVEISDDGTYLEAVTIAAPVS